MRAPDLPHVRCTLRGLAAVCALAVCALSLPAQTPPSATPAPAPAPAPRFVVVLDAAHGGADTGSRLASGAMEKFATLAFSVRLRSLLAARGIGVVTTRESDIAVDPDRRAAIANHAKAAACLTLHATESGSGIHLFTSSLAPGQPTRFIAWKTAQAPWIPRSLVLEGTVNSALQQAGMNVTLGRVPLIAVDSMTCPALALEIAPERSPDGKVTAEPDDPGYQARLATTLANALLAWRSDAARTEGRQP